MRQFELTAVGTDSQTPLTRFNFDAQMKLYYSPQEVGPIIGGINNVRLYHWDGARWQQVGSVYPGNSQNLLTVYTDLTDSAAERKPGDNQS